MHLCILVLLSGRQQLTSRKSEFYLHGFNPERTNSTHKSGDETEKFHRKTTFIFLTTQQLDLSLRC